MRKSHANFARARNDMSDGEAYESGDADYEWADVSDTEEENANNMSEQDLAASCSQLQDFRPTRTRGHPG